MNAGSAVMGCAFRMTIQDAVQGKYAVQEHAVSRVALQIQTALHQLLSAIHHHISASSVSRQAIAMTIIPVQQIHAAQIFVHMQLWQTGKLAQDAQVL